MGTVSGAARAPRGKPWRGSEKARSDRVKLHYTDAMVAKWQHLQGRQEDGTKALRLALKVLPFAPIDEKDRGQKPFDFNTWGAYRDSLDPGAHPTWRALST